MTSRQVLNRVRGGNVDAGGAVGTSARAAAVKDFRPSKCLVWLKARCELGEEDRNGSKKILKVLWWWFSC